METEKLTHRAAEEEREQKKFKEALAAYADARLSYTTEGNVPKAAETCAGEALTWHHVGNTLAGKQKALALVLQKEAVHTGLQILAQMEEENDAKKRVASLLAREQGRYLTTEGNWEEAYKAYEEAYYLAAPHEQGELLGYMGEVLGSMGKTQEAVEKLQEALRVIEEHKEAHGSDTYAYNVWKSGVLLRLARITKEPGYISEAEAIIASDDRLVLRQEELEKLKKELGIS